MRSTVLGLKIDSSSVVGPIGNLTCGPARIASPTRMKSVHSKLRRKTLEQLLEVRLVRIEEKLAGLDARLHAWSPASVNDAVRSGRDEQ